MDIVAKVLVGLVAAIHGYFLVLEMFLWRTPRGRAIFGTDPQFAERSAPLAANQGLYNGFLAAGLVWGLIAGGQDLLPGLRDRRRGVRCRDRQPPHPPRAGAAGRGGAGRRPARPLSTLGPPLSLAPYARV